MPPPKKQTVQAARTPGISLFSPAGILLIIFLLVVEGVVLYVIISTLVIPAPVTAEGGVKVGSEGEKSGPSPPIPIGDFYIRREGDWVYPLTIYVELDTKKIQAKNVSPKKYEDMIVAGAPMYRDKLSDYLSKDISLRDPEFKKKLKNFLRDLINAHIGEEIVKDIYLEGPIIEPQR